MVTDRKESTLGYGTIEIINRGDGWYELRINGELKEQSKDWAYIRRQFDKY
jgi:hypothetical protein